MLIRDTIPAMTPTDTIQRVPRPRGTLTDAQQRTLAKKTAKRDTAIDDYRAFVVGLLNDGCSYSEVRKATGVSTSTLQEWKKALS